MSSPHPAPSPLPGGGGAAAVFPGMAAASYADLGRFLVLDRYARPLVRAADEALGDSLLTGYRAEESTYGPFSQVAFLVASLACAERATAELGLRPDVCAGASFGHRPAAVLAGALSFPDAVRLTADLARCEVAYFGELGEELVTQCFVRVPDGVVSALLADFAERGEWLELSVELGDGSVMLSLPERLLDEVIATMREAGAYVMQTMRPAVHARRFTPLRELATPFVDRCALTDPALPLIADQDGRVLRTAAEVRTMLLDTFDHPVDWPAMVTSLAAGGAATAFVTGPDQLFHKLAATKRAFATVVPVTPKTAQRPVTQGV
ncbi:ACP S-malonyltransferase [Amycolatopsis sp. CA-161197]|uniref:ACP S-malonyltransferase n=1 Tax=Amycolatopsis sp. CA-161197 TaxID=3239922 RepID=UPI003D8D2143